MWRLATICAVLLLMAGCASPDSRFYALSAAPTPAATPSDLSVLVGPVITRSPSDSKYR